VLTDDVLAVASPSRYGHIEGLEASGAVRVWP
jgi:hypothetical protein